MDYTNRRATMKLWDPHTKKLKYCSSENIYEDDNNCLKSGCQVMNLCLAKIFPPFQH